ncbi:helix-turn-helix domain-containing protein [Natronomonas halophila]|uniref:helix-turn-helix domain-containing protein n=1 Tax=Natronomonas halophila TaxID=2747817 RepID=UPI0015B5BB5F|nr:helix-turn-helix domain-containing protein [Natronomonas halophila]QLD84536.1 helix-turn-helix domain-containing protein [Natronomonas halophila]
MRYFDFTLTPEDGGFHPVDQVIAADPSVSRQAIMHIDTLGDGTGVLLYRLQGDAEQVVPDLKDHADVIALDLLDADGDDFHLYLHLQPGDPAKTLMHLAEKYALMLDTPIEYTGRNSLKMTIIGSHEMLQEALDELPDDLTINVDEVGTYSPDRRDTLSMLTDRQLEVFRTAVELGYYEIPRRTTHEDIADRLECAPSTVDEHLRKAESRVLQTLVG